MPVSIKTPLSREQARQLKAGDSCLISGVIYTARDAAHKRLCELAEQGKELPIDPKDCTIYYVGPTPARPGEAIGSAGPTTSYRMDAYSPLMISLGETGMIGKGKRGPEVVRWMPLDRLMLETDAPYMAPEPHRGQRCDSTLIPCTAAKVAQLKGSSTEEILRITLENGRRFFNL